MLAKGQALVAWPDHEDPSLVTQETIPRVHVPRPIAPVDWHEVRLEQVGISFRHPFPTRFTREVRSAHSVYLSLSRSVNDFEVSVHAFKDPAVANRFLHAFGELPGSPPISLAQIVTYQGTEIL